MMKYTWRRSERYYTTYSTGYGKFVVYDRYRNRAIATAEQESNAIKLREHLNGENRQ
jgi:hypothetical protein